MHTLNCCCSCLGCRPFVDLLCDHSIWQLGAHATGAAVCSWLRWGHGTRLTRAVTLYAFSFWYIGFLTSFKNSPMSHLSGEISMVFSMPLTPAGLLISPPSLPHPPTLFPHSSMLQCLTGVWRRTRATGPQPRKLPMSSVCSSLSSELRRASQPLLAQSQQLQGQSQLPVQSQPLVLGRRLLDVWGSVGGANKNMVVFLVVNCEWQ